MPVTTRKTSTGFTNSTPGGVKGRGMTEENAKRQKRLLNALDHGWTPTRGKKRLLDHGK